MFLTGVSYVLYEKYRNSKEKVSFQQFCESKLQGTLKLLYLIVQNVSIPYDSLRAGLRKGSPKTIEAALAVGRRLFTLSKRLKYTELLLATNSVRMLAPKEHLHLVEKTTSVVVQRRQKTKNFNLRQPWDAVMEEEGKDVKSWVEGPLTAQRWAKSFATKQVFDSIDNRYTR